MTERETQTEHFKWQPFVGNCESFVEVLSEKNSHSPWIIVKFLDAYFRGWGQVVFSNNPISGLLVLVALSLGVPPRAALAAITGAVGIIWSAVIRVDANEISCGLTAFNPILIGIVTQYHYPLIFGSFNLKVWFALILGVILSVYLTSALTGFLSKWNAPCLTLPFILVQYLLVLSVLHPHGDDVRSPAPPREVAFTSPRTGVIWQFTTIQNATIRNNNTDTSESRGRTSDAAGEREQPLTPGQVIAATSVLWDNSAPAVSAPAATPAIPTTVAALLVTEPAERNAGQSGRQIDSIINHIKAVHHSLDWGRFLGGVLNSTSQLFFLADTRTACLLYLAMVIYSPTMCAFALVGAFLGSLTALLLVAPPPLAAIYAGVWGYNGVLTGAALGGLAFVVTCQTALATVFAVLFCALVQHALNIAVQGTRLPIYNLPFNIAVITFLCLAIALEATFPRPDNVSFPEKHRYEFVRKRQRPSPDRFYVVKSVKYESGASV